MSLGCCDDCTTLAVGIPGPPGATGPQGPPGPGGGEGGSYVHTQAVAASQWVITHNLGSMPVDATVWSLDYTIQWTNVQIEPLNTNQVTLWFDGAQTGIALIHI